MIFCRGNRSSIGVAFSNAKGGFPEKRKRFWFCVVLKRAYFEYLKFEKSKSKKTNNQTKHHALNQILKNLK